MTYRVEGFSETTLYEHSLREGARDCSALGQYEQTDVEPSQRTIEEAKDNELREIGDCEHESCNKECGCKRRAEAEPDRTPEIGVEDEVDDSLATTLAVDNRLNRVQTLKG